MTSLAIVVAVSEYEHENALPACGNDGKAVAHLLNATGRFDQVLLIDEDTTSSAVKGKIASFIQNHGGGSVEEFFFYFTGHGDFDGVDFQYILTDFNARKRKQTSLSNEELDGMVRSLAPKLYVKVVDACHSGVAYIKGPEELNEHLKSTKHTLSNVYFMFSSQNNQYSYQDDKISYFTDSFLKSIIDHSSDSIRYKDIMSYVADEFEDRGGQTPVFISQATLTEVFCEITSDLRSDLKRFVQLDNESADPVDPSKDIKWVSMLDRVSADAKRYCSKESALETVAELAKLASTLNLAPALTQLFDVSTHLEPHDPPSSDQIGRWLKSSNDEKYFAEPVIETESFQKRVLKNGLGLNLAQFGHLFGTDNEDSYKWVDAQREVVTGFKFSTDMPFNHICIKLAPKFPNIAPEHAYIVPMVSRTDLRVFSAFAHFEHYDWDKSRRVGKIEWTGREVTLKDYAKLSGVVDRIVEDFQNFVIEPLQTKWSGTVSDSASVAD